MLADDLTPRMLLSAYANGIFPMSDARDDPEVFWVDPAERGIIPLDGFRISRSLRRRILHGGARVTTDRAFDAVVAACAARDETWISHKLAALYGDLHEMGAAHSLEVWDGETLAGGVYGVTLGAAFFGESMVSRRTDASKVALAYLVDRLNRAGFQLFDTQFLTAHLASLGGVAVPRTVYRTRLKRALQATADFGQAGPVPLPDHLLQRRTQTS